MRTLPCFDELFALIRKEVADSYAYTYANSRTSNIVRRICLLNSASVFVLICRTHVLGIAVWADICIQLSASLFWNTKYKISRDESA